MLTFSYHSIKYMSFPNRLKTDRKYLLIFIGIVIGILLIPYVMLPALAIWWFYKTPKLSKGFKKIATGVALLMLSLAVIGGFIAYANDPEPHLVVSEPEANLTTQEQEITIKGTYNPQDRKVWINGDKINASNGSFESKYQLKNGENKIEVSAGDWKRAKVLLNIKRELTESEKQAIVTPTTIQSSPATSKAQKAPQTREEAIEKRIRDAVAKRSNTNKDKIAEIKINKSFADNADGKFVAVVTINGSDNLSEDLIKKGIWVDMADIYMALYKNYSDIQEATIIAKFPMSDKYGNNSDEVVLKTSLSSQEAKKVNWNADKSVLELSILPNVWNTQTNRFR